MRRLGNTLYVTSQGTYLSKEGDCVLVRPEEGPKKRVPLTVLDGIICFGRVSVSPFLLGHCAGSGVCVSHFTETGRFLARVEGPTRGNVLLRRAQYRATDDPAAGTGMARSCVIGKVANQRTVLRRARRDHGADAEGRLDRAVVALDAVLRRLPAASSIDTVRGLEGEAAAAYFDAFPALVRADDAAFRFTSRSRRPPLDPINAVLSFAYALLTHDVRAALEGVGLDPAVGFLHRERPGRPSLALDLVEEFRACFADRIVLSVVNRRQIGPADFNAAPTGAVSMTEDGRKTLLVAYQERKRDEIKHPFTGETVPLGLVWHIQARLMAMHLRGDLDAYPPFLWR